jgi:hypothetical protein
VVDELKARNSKFQSYLNIDPGEIEGMSKGQLIVIRAAQSPRPSVSGFRYYLHWGDSELKLSAKFRHFSFDTLLVKREKGIQEIAFRPIIILGRFLIYYFL